MKQLHIAIVGYGYWGPNLVRNFSQIRQAHVSTVCDLRSQLLKEIKRLYPDIRTTNAVKEIFSDPSIDAVVLATPISTHFPLAYQSLTHGKHTWIEKPLTIRRADAIRLVSLAKRRKVCLMVDHTFVYTPAVQKIREAIEKKELGDIVYIDSVRTNLGLIQNDSNVIYDLAAHDFAIFDYLFGVLPTHVSATGTNHLRLNQESVAHVVARYPNNIYVHCHVSWLSPVKIRTMQIIGSKKMLSYDDMEPSEKVKIYDKGISITTDPHDLYQRRIGYRMGSMVAPHIPMREGLFGAAQEFVSAIISKKTPLTDGASGTRVVTILEAATESLRNGGKLIKL